MTGMSCPKSWRVKPSHEGIPCSKLCSPVSWVPPEFWFLSRSLIQSTQNPLRCPKKLPCGGKNTMAGGRPVERSITRMAPKTPRTRWSLLWSWLFNILFNRLTGHSGVKNPPAMQETQVQFLGQEDPLQKEMATHSNILAGRISWTEEPGGLQSMRLQRVGHNWATKPQTLRWRLLLAEASSFVFLGPGQAFEFTSCLLVLQWVSLGSRL